MLSLIEVTFDGIVIDVNDEHPENALDPTEVTEDGIIIDERFEQPLKAHSSIDLRFDVMFTVFKLLHP